MVLHGVVTEEINMASIIVDNRSRSFHNGILKQSTSFMSRLVSSGAYNEKMWRAIIQTLSQQRVMPQVKSLRNVTGYQHVSNMLFESPQGDDSPTSLDLSITQGMQSSGKLAG